MQHTDPCEAHHVTSNGPFMHNPTSSTMHYVTLAPFFSSHSVKYTNTLYLHTLFSDPPQPVLTTIHQSRARAASEHNYPTADRLPCDVVFPCCTAWYKNSAEGEQKYSYQETAVMHSWVPWDLKEIVTLQYMTSSRPPAMQVIYFNARPLVRSVYVSATGVSDTSGEKVGCLPCVM